MHCIFCSIISSQNSFIYQDERYVVIKDIHPEAPIHYLIIPRNHIVNLKHTTHADDSSINGIFSVAKKLSDLIGSSYDFKILTNNGSYAGQVIFHMHTHFMAYPSRQNAS